LRFSCPLFVCVTLLAGTLAAADARLEKRDVLWAAVRAGDVVDAPRRDPLDDYVMATPAISKGSPLVRSQHFLFSLGKHAATNK
jgi:hypothetical protein